jgi:aspartate-semialdehyde dehydrogenase
LKTSLFKTPLRLAIVGATGLVGETLLALIEERHWPISSVKLFASESSVGEVLECGSKPVMVEALTSADFSDVDVAIFAVDNALALEYVPKAVAAGALVVDNSSAFRYDDEVPLVVPEVNGELLANMPPKGIIANPNCSTVQLAMALKPIVETYGVTRINVATYQSVSGAGKTALEGLVKQTAALLNAKPVDFAPFTKQMAFNVIPHIDVFEDNGYTREEMKMVREMQKIYADPNMLVNPTAVRVPVFYGHAMAVHVETAKKVNLKRLKTLFGAMPGVKLCDKQIDGGYATPVSDASGKDDVYISRLRQDLSSDKGCNLWVVADNLRKGAALNAAQIVESYLNQRELAGA